MGENGARIGTAIEVIQTGSKGAHQYALVSGTVLSFLEF